MFDLELDHIRHPHHQPAVQRKRLCFVTLYLRPPFSLGVRSCAKPVFGQEEKGPDSWSVQSVPTIGISVAIE